MALRRLPLSPPICGVAIGALLELSGYTPLPQMNPKAPGANVGGTSKGIEAGYAGKRGSRVRRDNADPSEYEPGDLILAKD